MKKYTRYKQKIFINSFLPLLLIILIGTGIFYAIKRNTAINRNLSLASDLKKTFSDLDNLKNSVLLSFFNENNLTQDADLKLQQKIKTVGNNFIVITEEINYARLLKKEEVADVFDSLSVSFDREVHNILQLNALTRIVGSPASGLVHDLLSAGKALSESIESTGSISLSNSMNNLLLAQSSFLNNPVNSTYTVLQSEVNTLKEELIMQEMPLTEVTEKAEKFFTLTGSLMSMIQKIGFDGEVSGLLHDYYETRKVASGLINRLDTCFTETTKSRKQFATILFAGIGLIVFLSVSLVYFNRVKRLIYHPVDAVINFVKVMLTGAFPEKDLQINTTDELETLGNELNKISGSLIEKTQFLKTLNAGDLNAKLNLLSKNDLLGSALLEIQVAIQKSADEQRKHDEENTRRRFINEGLARFSEITHARYESIEALTDIFIKELVKYLESLQGGVFLIRETEGITDLYLASAFAFDRKKYLSKTVTLGEGLVGTCAVEKRLIVLTEVPPEYISITSGLGDAPPNVILLVPMLQDNNLAGVIEIASLRNYKDHQLEFVKQVANNLANTLASTRINERTSKLLFESQLHAQTMSEQEEEMRQNMEELKATQEESARREEEFKGIADALSQSVFVAEFDLKGHLITINEKFLVFLGKKQDQVLGKTFDVIIGNETGTLFDEKALEEVLGGKHKIANHKIKIGKRKEYTLQFHFSAELNRNEFPFKILCLGIEIMS